MRQLRPAACTAAICSVRELTRNNAFCCCCMAAGNRSEFALPMATLALLCPELSHIQTYAQWQPLPQAATATQPLVRPPLLAATVAAPAALSEYLEGEADGLQVIKDCFDAMNLTKSETGSEDDDHSLQMLSATTRDYSHLAALLCRARDGMHGRNILQVAIRHAADPAVAKLASVLVCNEPFQTALLPATDNHGRTALHELVDGPRAEVDGVDLLHLLLDAVEPAHHELIQLSDKGGVAALHLAAAQNDEIAIARLLELRADCNADSNSGTALHWAAGAGASKAAQVLLQAPGVETEALDAYGITPLLLAAVNGSFATIQALVQADADCSAALPGGISALHVCADAGNVDAVTLLLDCDDVMALRLTDAGELPVCRPSLL